MIVEAGKYYKTRDGRKVGPMVDIRNSKGWSKSWAFTVDHPLETTFGKGWRYDGTFDPYSPDKEDILDLIAEWTETPQGPVRTKTVTEIVPGVYGRITTGGKVFKDGSYVSVSFTNSNGIGNPGQHLDATELRAAALVLTQLAQALEE